MFGKKTEGNVADKELISNADETKGIKLLTGPKGNRRNLPGTSSYGPGLPKITEGKKWLIGSHGNAGKVPEQIAEKLSGKKFNNFNEFREAFWKEVVSDPVLRKQLRKSSIREMTHGRAPYAVPSQ